MRVFYIKVGGASPPIPESAAATATPDPWRELLQTLICKVSASGLQCMKGSLTHSTGDRKLEDPWISDVARGCVGRSRLTLRHPAQR